MPDCRWRRADFYNSRLVRIIRELTQQDGWKTKKCGARLRFYPEFGPGFWISVVWKFGSWISTFPRTSHFERKKMTRNSNALKRDGSVMPDSDVLDFLSGSTDSSINFSRSTDLHTHIHRPQTTSRCFSRNQFIDSDNPYSRQGRGPIRPIMYQSNRSLNIPPGQPPAYLNFWKIFVQVPPSRG